MIEYNLRRSEKKVKPDDFIECGNCYRKHGPILEELDTCDWAEAFVYSPYSREEVTDIIMSSEGENDGPDWLMAFKTEDGKFVGLSAGCDYTGWD